jgi:hypothetical protein
MRTIKLSAIGRLAIIPTLLAGLSLFAWLPSARGQQAVSLASLEISLWPEFDKPSTLVIINGQVAAGVPLPVELSIHIPAAAGGPSAVAVVGADGGLFQTPYTTSQAGGDIISKFTTNSVGFHVEYYDPALLISGDARSYAFHWKSDAAIQAVTVRVQEPYGARNLTGQPALTSAGAGEYGLTYYTASLGPLAAGGTLSFNLGYAKTGNALSATAVANAQGGASSPASTQGAPAANGTNSSQPWIVGAAVAGLVLTGGVVAWYMRFAPATQGQVRRRRTTGQGRRGTAQPAGAAQARKRPAPARTSAKAAAGVAVDKSPAAYCPQCGQRYKSGDRFCRQCGTPVRE